MNIILNRQDAKGAKVIEPPRRQDAKKIVLRFFAGCNSSAITVLRRLIDKLLLTKLSNLGALASWRFKQISWRSWRLGGLNGFLGVIGALAVQEGLQA